MEFNIGQRVTVKPYGELAEKRFAKVRGKSGVIVDKITSEVTKTTYYRVKFDGSAYVSTIDFTGDEFVTTPKEKTYTVELEIAGNVAIAVLFEVEDGQKTRVIHRGHGHIIHEGAEGVTQAVSYACKRLYQKVFDSKITIA